MLKMDVVPSEALLEHYKIAFRVNMGSKLLALKGVCYSGGLLTTVMAIVEESFFSDDAW